MLKQSKLGTTLIYSGTPLGGGPSYRPQLVVMASFHTAATFSRSDWSLISIKGGKSSAISLTSKFIIYH
jgi:hypothetical protein